MPTPSKATNYEQEIEYWAAKLRADELEFANLYLNRTVNGYTIGQCYQLTHPNSTSTYASLQANGRRTAHSYSVSGYIQAMRQESVGDTIMGLDELKEDLTIQIRGYDHLFEGYVVWEETPIGRVAFVDKLEDVPERLKKYVNGHLYHAESEGYELYLRQYPGKESDKNKARELLAKMQGGLIERKEVSLNGVLATELIDKRMTDSEVEAAYKRVMRRE